MSSMDIDNGMLAYVLIRYLPMETPIFYVVPGITMA
jgi:hypothetical protein